MEQKLDAWIPDHEEYAITSSRLRDLIEKSGRMTLWDACKALGWSINKGKNVVERMLATNRIFVAKSARNGRAIKILSIDPIISTTEQLQIGNEPRVMKAQIEVQNSLIEAVMMIQVSDIKDYVSKYFDFSEFPEEVIKKIRFGGAVLDVAAKKIGFSGANDPKLRKLLMRDTA